MKPKALIVRSAVLLAGIARLTGQTPDDVANLHKLSLAPGEGTILCLGTNGDFAAVKQIYFSPASAAETTKPETSRPYRLDFMPMGFYLGDKAFYEKAAAEMGLDVWTYLGRLLDHLKASGANTIYLQGGSLSSTDMPKFVHERGFKVILQMDDLYFRGTDYLKARKAHGPNTPDRANTSKDLSSRSLRNSFLPSKRTLSSGRAVRWRNCPPTANASSRPTRK